MFTESPWTFAGFATQLEHVGGVARCTRSVSLATTLADFKINNIAGGHCENSVITPIMLSVLWLAFGSLFRIFRNRRNLISKNLVLRQQLPC